MKRNGLVGASGTATRRPSMMSPTTSSRVVGGRSRTLGAGAVGAGVDGSSGVV